MPEKKLKAGWQVWRFDQMATNVNARIDKPSESGMTHYVGLEHLDADSLKIRRWGTPDDVEATKLMFKKGDIIFGKRRAYQRKLGVADFDGICSAHALVLRAKPEVVIPEFLPFFMQSDLFMNRAVEISVGSLSPTINWKALAKQEFALPAIPEQHKLCKLLLEIQRVKNETTNLVNSLISLREALAFDSWVKFKYLKEVTLEEVCEKIQDGTHFSPQTTSGEFQYVTSKNIKDGFIDLTNCGWISKAEHEDIFRRCDVRHGDILLTKDGANTGNVAINTIQAPFSLLSSVALLRPKECIKNRYLFEFLRSKIGRQRIVAKMSGTAIPRVTLTQIKSISIPIVSPTKQEELSKQFLEIEHAYNAALSRQAQSYALYYLTVSKTTS